MRFATLMPSSLRHNTPLLPAPRRLMIIAATPMREESRAIIEATITARYGEARYSRRRGARRVAQAKMMAERHYRYTAIRRDSVEML